MILAGLSQSCILILGQLKLLYIKLQKYSLRSLPKNKYSTKGLKTQMKKKHFDVVYPVRENCHSRSFHVNFILCLLVGYPQGCHPWMVLPLGGVHKLRLQDLAFFDHLPPSVYIFYGINVYKKSIFLTTYPPPLVNVVCERPLIQEGH